MKVEQEKPKFKPVTITLETREDADAFHGMIEAISSSELADKLEDNERALAIRISNAFTSEVVY